MQSVAVAQDKPAQPQADKSDKADKNNKTDKTDKKDKTPNDLAPITLNDLAVNFPDVEGWEKSEIQKYPTEDLGFSINYESRHGGRVTIYVYNGGKKKIADGVTDKVIKEQLNKAKDEIKQVAEMGYYENLKELKNDTVTLGGTEGKVKVLYTLYNFGSGEKYVASEIYIFGHRNRFIKIRATRLRDKNETGNKMVADLLKEIDTFFSN
jgi:hypothetical protein